MPAFRARRPGVRLALREATSDVQGPALVAGEIDVGFVIPGAAHAALAYAPLHREPMIAALPSRRRWPRACRCACSPTSRSSCSRARSRRELHDAIVALCRRAGFTPRIGQEAIQMQTIVSLVAGGMGVALVPASLEHLRRDGVVYRALAERSPRVEIGLAWRASDDSPLTRAFVAEARAAADDPPRPMTFVHPQFDPIALQIGPLAIRWYGLMYVLAFVLVLVLGRIRARRNMLTGWRAHDVDDMLFYGVFGVILGGRLGYVLFYKPMYYLEHPLEIFAVWQGGMSFHGGLLGVLVALWLYSRKRGKRWLDVTDFVAPLVPLGLGAGRLGNFINGELWGRPTGVDVGHGVPARRQRCARHPSQLYEFALEGLLLFAILWSFANRPRPMGAVSGLFLLGYGAMRFVVEYVREPDALPRTCRWG